MSFLMGTPTAVRYCGEEELCPLQQDRPGPGRSVGHSLGPDNGVVKLGVDGLQVLQCGPLVQHPLVEGQREASVNELPMVQSLWCGGDAGSHRTSRRSTR